VVVVVVAGVVVAAAMPEDVVVVPQAGRLHVSGHNALINGLAQP